MCPCFIGITLGGGTTHAQNGRLSQALLLAGAMNSERATDLFEVLGDPYQGALWSGPPYRSSLWRSITADRVAGSPAWLPRFRDGSIVRFMNLGGTSIDAGSPWGPMRIRE